MNPTTGGIQVPHFLWLHPNPHTYMLLIMKIDFTKMHGLGNDFVVIDALRQDIQLTPEQIRFIADRHRGVGCDQLLLVEKPSHPGVDFRYRIFNADGGEVEQCGNGARCFAKFVRDSGLTEHTSIPVETSSGNIVLIIQEDGEIVVDMGVPNFDPDRLPFTQSQRQDKYAIEVEDQVLEIGAVSMGNPHAVMLVEDIDKAPVTDLGPLLEAHSLFPKRVNVGFMQIVDRQSIRLRVFERGVGETQACGTGACAAVVIGRQWGLLDELVTAELSGGRLLINWSGEGRSVRMTGPAESVFEGTIHL